MTGVCLRNGKDDLHCTGEIISAGCRDFDFRPRIRLMGETDGVYMVDLKVI